MSHTANEAACANATQLPPSDEQPRQPHTCSHSVAIDADDASAGNVILERWPVHHNLKLPLSVAPDELELVVNCTPCNTNMMHTARTNSTQRS